MNNTENGFTDGGCDFIFQPPTDEPPESGCEAEKSSSIDETDKNDGSVTVDRNGTYIHCLTVIGQIEGHYILPANSKTTKYEHIIPRLVAVENSRDIKGLLVILNTVGGDIEAGLAIAELIAGMKKPTVSLVLGGGHSIGVPLAVSADRSFIAPSASMTVHPVRMNGLVLGVDRTMRYFERVEERIVGFIERNSGISGERFRELMRKTEELTLDMGTVLSGEDAVREGLIDEVGGLSDAFAAFDALTGKDSGG